MNKILLYFLIYLFGCLSGLFIESIYSYITMSDPFIPTIQNTFFNFFGISLLIVTLFLDWVKNKLKYPFDLKDIIVYFILIYIFLFFFECIGGILSFSIYKKQNWNYNENVNISYNFSTCYGYVSFLNTFIFTCLVIIWSIFIYDYI